MTPSDPARDPLAAALRAQAVALFTSSFASGRVGDKVTIDTVAFDALIDAVMAATASERGYQPGDSAKVAAVYAAATADPQTARDPLAAALQEARERSVRRVAIYLHRVGVGCDGHRGDDPATADAMHRDDAYGIYDEFALPSAAIRDTPATTPTADGLRQAVVGLDWEGCGGWGCSDNMAATLDAVLALLEAR